MHIKFMELVFAGLLLVATAAQAALPIQHWRMDNGVRVIFIENHDLPLLDVSVEFPAGDSRDDKSSPGLASMTHHLLTLGAGGMTEEEISRRMADIGASLGGSFDQDRAGLRLRTLSGERERGQALEIMAKSLQFPAFPEAVLAREKTRSIAELKEAKTQPDFIAGRLFNSMIYGTHPYALSSMVEPESIAALRREDLVGFYRAHYRADEAVVAVIGDVTPAQAREIAAQLTAALPRAEGELQSLPVVAMSMGETRKIAHPATQSHILIGQPGMTRTDPDYFPLYVGNYILGGGGFASRLIEEVRQKRGLVYSVYSYFLPLQQSGPFQIGLQTKREQAEEALVVVRKTLRDFIAKGPTEDELKKARQNIVGGFPLRLDSNKKILDYLAVIGFYRLPLSYLDDFSGNVEKVTVAQIRDAFTRRIQPDNMATVVVGADEAK
ncbi:peptidase M16-like protein [Sulfuricella denitrificans skB26]|uniref:Peptidase M16-like protein n=1 Tax=Sulfuricella denitrificans (strain DSM 22764 / NBRC 105220 / skB26) TaxID=1163617 RepID=S6AJD1_SULDS|nr:pitrilysin family protein [Sulfuricella denitrificans]BAN36436.1 peptidase M16-like protein [Sulfuricella denitrificans skB26]